MMATLSLTGTITSWQQTVGMRRSVECSRASVCFFLFPLLELNTAGSQTYNYTEQIIADIVSVSVYQ